MVRIIQLLCPLRHALMAVAYESPTGEARPEAMREMEALVGDLVNPWCDICASREVQFEDAPTKFRNMEEAKPALARMEAEQLLTRVHIDMLKKKARSN